MERIFFTSAFALAALAFQSCDSREDWFEMNSEMPALVYEMNGVRDTIEQGELCKLTVNLHPVECRTEYCTYCTDTCLIKLSVISGRGKSKIEEVEWDVLEKQNGVLYIGTNETYLSPSYFSCKEDTAFLSICAVIEPEECQGPLFEDDRAAKLWGSRQGSFVVCDVFGNKTNYTIEINVTGNTPPTAVLEHRKLKGLEYELSMTGSSDPDGHVEKFEWCVDGNVVPYKATDTRLEYVKDRYAVWKTGQAAYGGTYVTATAINSINHSFQTPGEHVVYYRCMDNLGLWSLWYSQTINIEEE